MMMPLRVGGCQHIVANHTPVDRHTIDRQRDATDTIVSYDICSVDRKE